MTSRRLHGALAATLALACGDGAPPAAAEADLAPPPPRRQWPAGTVLAVDDLPVRAEDVDPVADAVARLYPANVEQQNRRLALTNDVLERFAVASRDRAARAVARERCEALAATVGPDDEPPGVERLQGHFGLLDDLGLWAAAWRLEPGSWSAPIDLVGRWALVRVDVRDRGRAALEEWFELSVVVFPYLDLTAAPDGDPRSSIRAAVEDARLEIVDPDWDRLVPAEWKHRMGALQGSRTSR